MSNSLSLQGIFGAHHGPARESRSTEDHDVGSFAGMLAGATHAGAKPLHHSKPTDGTSDLDGSENTNTSADSNEVADADAADATATTDAGADAAATTDKTAKAHEPRAIPLVEVSLSSLDPALQQKLARVLERVRDETGHTANVTETYRSQARQNTLFAQGRSAPGEVVTWSQHSKHTEGRAVDVQLDGGHAAANAYTVLQRIANEEGLRTLGARDPGHLELPANRVTAESLHDVAPTNPVAPADASGRGQVSIARLVQVARVEQLETTPHAAHVATVSQVASVAQVAKAAHVATVARVGGAADAADAAREAGAAGAPGAGRARGTDASALNKGGLAKVPPLAAAAASQMASSVAGKGQGFGGGRQQSDRERGGYGTLIDVRTQAASPVAVPDVAADVGSTAPQRVERIAAADDAPARPLSQIVMSVDAGNGATDRIHVALRGASVSATIDAADHHAAHAMRANSDELVRALTRDGVEVEALRVRAAATAVPVVEVAQRSSEASNGSRFQRGTEWEQRNNHERSDSERRQQRRDERGGQES